MPENEGEEVPMDNEIMLDRIEFVVNDNEESMVGRIILKCHEFLYIDLQIQPSQMEIPSSPRVNKTYF